MSPPWRSHYRNSLPWAHTSLLHSSRFISCFVSHHSECAFLNLIAVSFTGSQHHQGRDHTPFSCAHYSSGRQFPLVTGSSFPFLYLLLVKSQFHWVLRRWDCVLKANLARNLEKTESFPSLIIKTGWRETLALNSSWGMFFGVVWSCLCHVTAIQERSGDVQGQPCWELK